MGKADCSSECDVISTHCREIACEASSRIVLEPRKNTEKHVEYF